MCKQEPVKNILTPIIRWISISLLAGAVIISIIQFLNMRGLWTDEAAVAINIVERDYAGLMKPLDFLQVAPILYLWIVKFLSQIFSEQEWGLRLYSLISYICSLWLFWRMLRRYVKDEVAILLGIIFFVLNNKLFYYADEVKQYMSDVMVTLTLLTLAMDWRDDDRRPTLILSFAGIVGIFLSNISVMILPTVFLICLFSDGNPWHRRRIMNLFLLSFPWLIAFVANYFLFIHGHPSRDQQMAAWKDAFPPTDIFTRQIIFFIFNVFELLKRDFGFGVNNMLRIFGPSEIIHLVIMAIMMMAYFFRVLGDRSKAWILFIPLCFHFILAYLRLYPMAPRTMLYIYPLMALMLSMGAESIFRWLQRFSGMIRGLVITGTLLLTVIFVNAFIPRTVEESRPVLSYMQAHGKPGLVTFSFASGNSMLGYYVHIGVYKPMGPVFYAQARGHDIKIHVDEIVQLNREAWIFIAHFQSRQKTGLLDGLRAHGYSLTDSVQAKGVEAFHIVPPLR